MQIAAYKERTSYDPMTGEEGILRDEWRVRRVSEFAPEDLAEQFGPEWRRSRPFAEFVLEHRYIRRSVEEPWTPFDAANTYAQALEYIDGTAVAEDPILVEIQEGREQYAKERAEEEGRRRLEAVEEEEKRYRKQRSAEAFEKLLASRDRAWAERWNQFVEQAREDEEFLDQAREDERFMELYTAVFDAHTMPSKRKAIKTFLREFAT